MFLIFAYFLVLNPSKCLERNTPDIDLMILM